MQAVNVEGLASSPWVIPTSRTLPPCSCLRLLLLTATCSCPIDRTGRLYYFAGIIVSDPVGLTLKVHDSQESKTRAQF